MHHRKAVEGQEAVQDADHEQIQVVRAALLESAVRFERVRKEDRQTHNAKTSNELRVTFLASKSFTYCTDC